MQPTYTQKEITSVWVGLQNEHPAAALWPASRPARAGAETGSGASPMSGVVASTLCSALPRVPGHGPSLGAGHGGEFRIHFSFSNGGYVWQVSKCLSERALGAAMATRLTKQRAPSLQHVQRFLRPNRNIANLSTGRDYSVRPLRSASSSHSGGSTASPFPTLQTSVLPCCLWHHCTSCRWKLGFFFCSPMVANFLTVFEMLTFVNKLPVQI